MLVTKSQSSSSAHTSCWQSPLPITIPNCRGEQRAARWDVMQTITGQVYCIGLTETYCANLASRSSEEPWGSVAQPGSVVSGSFHPPASTFYRFNNLGWICSIKGCSEAVTIYHQADWNCFFFLQIIDGKSHNLPDSNNNFPCTKMIKENGLVVMVTSYLDLYFWQL